MAIVLTALTPEQTFFPWRDRGQNLGRGVAPMGELIVNTRDGTITLSGSGDTQELRWAFNLPVNYSYIMIDYSAAINIPAATNTWDTLQALVYQDTTSQAFQTMEYGVGLITEGVARYPGTVNQVQVWRPASPLPTFMQNGGSLWQSTFVNTTLEEPEANFNGTARFLQYTIEQQFDSGINTPLLIR